MEISEQLRCLFSAEVEVRDQSYVVEVPEQELQLGDLREGETYRLAILPSLSPSVSGEAEPEGDRERGQPTPPVEEGETRTVEIEDIGEQGDGIARVERGFVLIIPDTEQGERVTVEITDIRESVAFARVVNRVSYYE